MSFISKALGSVLGVTAIAASSLLPKPAEAGQQCGQASFYGVGDGYQGQRTASGRIFDTNTNQAAHRFLPFGTRVQVRAGGRTTSVVITDRGPFSHGRIIDLSSKSFGELAPHSRGVIPVCISW